MKKDKILIKTLVYGYGDVKHHDEGIGEAMIRRLRSWISDNFIFDVDLKSSASLSLDDIEIISRYTRVIFVESSEKKVDTCELIKIKADKKVKQNAALEYDPQFLLNECYRIHKRKPQCYYMSISGKEWTFEEGLSEFASMNLDKAELFLRSVLRNSIYKKPIFHNFKVNKHLEKM